MKHGYVYILASKRNGTLYIGVTSDLVRRCNQHMAGTGGIFSEKYSVKILVYYEVFNDISEAIAREKAIKKWNRAWKLALIEQSNPDWIDLSADVAL